MGNSSFLSLGEHDLFELIEDEFNDALDESLGPGGPDMLFDLVAELGLPAAAVAVDVGCNEGRHSVELARRFDFSVLGVDPVERHVDAAREGAATGTLGQGSVRFELGRAQDLPVESGTVHLVWCRDVLCMVEDLDAAYAEFRRVLKPGGHALIYQMFATDRLEPRESAWLLPTMSCISESMQPGRAEAAIRAAGLQIDRCLVLGSEWGEYGQEQTGKGARKLLHAARLLRDPERYLDRYGRANYEIALGDSLWHVYRLIGKLSDRVYLLSPGSS